MKNRVVAHRGNAAEHRENSLDAIRSAIDLGVSYVEFDVQMSADGVPVLLHDCYLTRLYGKDREAADTRLQALKSYGIASLDEAAALLALHKSVTAFVELKTDGMERFGRELVVRCVCELLDRDQCVVISFDLESLYFARSLGFRVGAVLRNLNVDNEVRCQALNPEFTFCDYRVITRDLWAGTQWVCYEVRDVAVAHDLVARGVSLIETMCVRQMMSDLA
jgi:glycerophosphoryl diester phosphodiesterase